MNDKSHIRLGGAVVAAILFVAGCSGGSDSSTAQNTPPAGAPPAGAPAPAPAASTGASGTWASVGGILTANCAPCHGAGRPKAGIDLTSYDGVMKGGKEGPIIVAGKPDDSVIVKAITGVAGVKKMPPRGALQQPDIDSIKAWIQAGAKQS